LNRRILSAPALRGVAAGLIAALAGGSSGLSGLGYAPATAASLDTLRLRPAGPVHHTGGPLLDLGAVIPGYLSPRGLPPLQGRLTLTDTGLVFQSSAGSATTFPLVGPLRKARGRQWRASTVSLAYTDEEGGRPIYVFRVDAGVFETEAPGALLDVSAHPGWLDSLGSVEWPTETPLVDGRNSAAVWAVARDLARSAYADSLYLLFGRPRAPIGLVGERGRSAGRLGEYIASRDSLALDPERMSAVVQLRHALAHELGHRWQARAPGQIATLWRGVTPIRDPKRYGYGDVAEHQAEAMAFAINFLQNTAAADGRSGSAALTLLDHYELFVPGTRTMVRYFFGRCSLPDHSPDAPLSFRAKPLRARSASGQGM
jgi:hypothetical protein